MIGQAMDKMDLSSQATTAASLLVALTREIFSSDDSLAEQMPLAQLRVCGILYRGPRPMSALSRELGVSVSAMTQIADRLERARLVHRVPDGMARSGGSRHRAGGAVPQSLPAGLLAETVT